ncbi:MAG: esterase family protein [Anaerolineaceae bacterium]|nr:MAG: esterase family protein [Anaerolineaceae bacterium]
MKKNLLARIRTEGHPLIDGNRVTFIWEGDSPPHLVDDLHDWEENPQKLRRVSPGLFASSFDLARDAYLEYAFYYPETKTRVPDPLNPRRIWNGVGNYNHFFYMPEASPSPWTIRQRDIPRGTFSLHTVETWMMNFPGKRRVRLYHPPTDERVPLLTVYDGPDYFNRGRLPIIVDNLIAAKRIRPIAMAFLPNGGPRRGVEYACSDATLAWIEHDVLPLASRELNLIDIKKEPGAFGVLGASFGGLMSVYTGLRLPEIFGRVLSQSPVFETEGRDFVAVDLIRHAHLQNEVVRNGIPQSTSLAGFHPAPQQYPKIYIDVGTMDFLLEDNRRMLPLLRERGFDLTYHEYVGAHNYTSWRDHIHLGLEKMFG